ncbi:hypothetical protein BSSX_p0054 (plasmid) [Bacillus subtilis]|nr:hypothetical protein BSSX_p0054 [Bacillus subtilis]
MEILGNRDYLKISKIKKAQKKPLQSVIICRMIDMKVGVLCLRFILCLQDDIGVSSSVGYNVNCFANTMLYHRNHIVNNLLTKDYWQFHTY